MPTPVTIRAPTAIQEAFARGWVLHRHPVNAYESCVDTTSMARSAINREGRKLFNDPVVQGRIRELLNADLQEDRRSLAAIFRWLTDVITADPNEVVQHRIGCCRHCWGEGHRYQWTMNEYLAAMTQADADNVGAKPGREVRYPDCSGGFDFDQTLAPALDCPECHGRGRGYMWVADTRDLSPGGQALYAGLQQTKDGMKVLFADKMRAAEMAVRMMGGFHDNAHIKLTADMRALVGVVDATQEVVDPAKAAELYAKMIRDTSLTVASNRGK